MSPTVFRSGKYRKRRSSARGARTSAEVEVLGLTHRALWMLVQGRELMLDFKRFPWFERATMADVREVTLAFGHHLHWPRLDVDLHVDSIDHPERFPLVAAKAKAPRKAKRRN